MEKKPRQAQGRASSNGPSLPTTVENSSAGLLLLVKRPRTHTDKARQIRKRHSVRMFLLQTIPDSCFGEVLLGRLRRLQHCYGIGHMLLKCSGLAAKLALMFLGVCR